MTAEGHSDSLVDILIDKARAGIPVYLITDRKQSDGVDAEGNKVWYNDRTEDRLRAGGVHVYEAINNASPYTAMHHKVGILGRTNIRVITDAANWTKAGLGSSSAVAKNIESQLFFDSAKMQDNHIGLRYYMRWIRVLERFAEQSAGDGEPGYAEALRELRSIPNWPTQSVVFQVETETNWGESVLIRGDKEELGDWGRVGPEVGLNTDEDNYPVWSSARVELPLGDTFEWKSLIDSGKGWNRWEKGENHEGVAEPGFLREVQHVVVETAW